MNVLLDYISIKGAGSARDFWAACRAAGHHRPWEALEVLSNLGHLDAVLVGRGWWSCSKPTIATLPGRPGEGVVCGARSQGLLQCIETHFRLEISPQDRGPDVWSIKARDNRELSGLAEECLLLCSQSPAAWNLARALPPLNTYLELVSSARPLPSSDEDPYRWHPATGIWEQRPFRRDPGLWMFHARYSGKPIFVLSTPSEIREVGDVGAAQTYLLTGLASVALYDPARGTLRLRPGVSLPRPYARALCLCSGFLAGKGEGGFMLFQSVPENIAKTVSVRLGLNFSGGSNT